MNPKTPSHQPNEKLNEAHRQSNVGSEQANLVQQPRKKFRQIPSRYMAQPKKLEPACNENKLTQEPYSSSELQGLSNSKLEEKRLLEARLTQWQFLKLSSHLNFESQRKIAEKQIQSGEKYIDQLKLDLDTYQNEKELLMRKIQEYPILEKQLSYLENILPELSLMRENYLVLSKRISFAAEQLPIRNLEIGDLDYLTKIMKTLHERVKLFLLGSLECRDKLSTLTGSLSELISVVKLEYKEIVECYNLALKLEEANLKENVSRADLDLRSNLNH